MRVYKSSRAGGAVLLPHRQSGLHLFKADSFRARLSGLHAYPYLPVNAGLWLVPCQAIHTFGLGYAIDVLFISRTCRIIKVVHNLRPGRITVCFAAHSVVELRGGYCRANPDYRHVVGRAVARLC